VCESRSLELQFNDFAGPVPAAIGGLTALQQLLAQGNQLSGALPEAFSTLTTLQYDRAVAFVQPHVALTAPDRARRTLQLQQNQLSGDLPITLGGAFSLR
jgi:hypothetical protein